MSSFATVLFFAMFGAGVVFAEPVTVRDEKADTVALWRNVDAWDACADEQQATGRSGAICRSGLSRC